MKNFWLRLITGLIFILAVVGGLWWNEYSYLFIFLTVVFLGMLEFIEIIKVGKKVSIQGYWSLIIGVFWYLILFFILRNNISAKWLFLLVPFLISVFITELFRKKDTPILNIAVTLLAPFYVAFPFSFLHFLAFHHGVYDYKLLLSFFVLIWANDTGAYCVGVVLGRNKFFPRISPNKTWEGFFGGVLITILVGVLISRFDASLTVFQWALASLVVSTMGSLGDLVESMIKRSVGVKDSGSFLPGHGGVLDRFDAVIFAAPMMVSLLFLLHYFGLSYC